MKVKIWPHNKGDGGILCMPLYENIPDPTSKHPDWRLVSCRRCKRDCWESDMHREILQLEPDVTALCTECAVFLGMMNARHE